MLSTLVFNALADPSIRSFEIKILSKMFFLILFKSVKLFDVIYIFILSLKKYLKTEATHKPIVPIPIIRTFLFL